MPYLDTSELGVDGLLDDGLEPGGDERDWCVETHVAVAQDHSRLALLLSLRLGVLNTVNTQ